MSKFGIFFQNRKKLVEFAVGKKKSKIFSIYLSKNGEIWPEKKDTGKDLERSFMGIQVQCSAVHY